MKKIFLVLVFFLGTNVFFAQETIVETEEENAAWQLSFDEAIKKAKAEKKPVLVYFTGSDWCMPCKRIDKELFHTDKFKDFSEKNLILYKADFPRNRDLVSSEARKSNEKLKFKYDIGSFPTMVMINAEGNILGEKRGSYMTEYYYPFFEAIVNSY